MTIQKCDGCGAEMPPGSRPTIDEFEYYIHTSRGLACCVRITPSLVHDYANTTIHFCQKCLVNALANRVNAMKEAL